RSLMRTVTELPLRTLVTLSTDPKGRWRCAAVSASGFIRSPEAAFDVSAYQDARPHCCACAGAADNTAAISSDAAYFILMYNEPRELNLRKSPRTFGAPALSGGTGKCCRARPDPSGPGLPKGQMRPQTVAEPPGKSLVESHCFVW